ncbi:Hypothetical predicted protein [Paramuricea clavata]|uniref:Uncharacterized protein n=1 Tax=Paramuricea clavata TaxID=317549 RepID=A0A6S7GGP7_PARCT|nr:Hypothetical predicted protein [Paramuricea clavata]
MDTQKPKYSHGPIHNQSVTRRSKLSKILTKNPTAPPPPMAQLKDIDTQADEAANQLISTYLNDSFFNSLPEELVMTTTTTNPLSPLSTISPHAPPPTEKPKSPPIAQKNIEKMKEIGKPTTKQRRVANITPHTNDNKKCPGRPTRHETLTKIANQSDKESTISSKELILYTLDGSVKKKKTVLTCSQDDIKLQNMKHYKCYEFITDMQQKTLNSIKEHKDTLEYLIYMEKMLEKNIFSEKNVK